MPERIPGPDAKREGHIPSRSSGERSAAERWESAGDFVSRSLAWLDEHPDAPVRERAAMGLVVACGGVQAREGVTFGDVADVIGIEANEVAQGLYSLHDEAQSRG